MWDTRKLLLATIVFTAAFYRLAADETIEMDSAPNAVDDLYDTCSEETKRKLTDLLDKELKSSVEFKTAWDKDTKCSEQVPEEKKKQVTALSAYVNGGEDFQKLFNSEVQTKGVNVSTYENDFNFKSLHFLLMSSMKKQSSDNCKTVYWLDDNSYHAKENVSARLGKFMIAKSYAESKKLWPDESVILNITSCFFVDLSDTCLSVPNAVLLSPAEEFTVERTYNEVSDDGDYTFIALKHSNVKSSNHACYSSRSHANVSSQWLVLVLVALSLFFMNC